MKTIHGNLDYREPPERKSRHARIVHDLGMRIVGGEFKPGERLPAEVLLLAEYEVSGIMAHVPQQQPFSPGGKHPLALS